MYNKMSKQKNTLDINVQEISFTQQNGFISSQLVLALSGKDMNSVIANTLRRVSYDDIPTYAFEQINIEHNNSKAFDNDFMTMHLRQLPIYDIKTDLYYLHPKYWQNIDYSDKNRQKHESELSIEGVINVLNNTNELMNVTTKQLSYYIDGKQVEYPNRRPDHPILLIELLPNQTFKCQMKAYLGVGEKDSIWFASKLSYYNYDSDPNNITFTIESTGQFSEYEILIKCCKLIKLKLNAIKNEVQNRIDTKEIRPSQIIHIDLANEDHTIGNLINNALQDHQQIAFSGVSKPDHLVKLIKFKIQSIDDVESPLGALFEVIDYLKSVFTLIEKKFSDLSNITIPDVEDIDY